MASSILVFACSLSMQLHVLRDPQWLGIVALGIAIASVPGAAIEALLFRRSELLLVLGAQFLTISSLIAWFAVRA
ncbi:hypothetical protein [Xanthomonas bonasiae]|uniref:hypothetical protein n=1 Tax=Xanthomonas bonasiae TaxID=2810351 RepID=UPI001CD8918F|nr:hypothetical protein [Xanthomonas surreyensis]